MDPIGTIVKKVTKREIGVGYFRVVQQKVGNGKDVWIFDDRSGKSVAIKELDFETILRKLFKINVIYKAGT